VIAVPISAGFREGAAMTVGEAIAVGDLLMIRRVYCQLRSEGIPVEGNPRQLAANLVYLYRIGVKDEKQLLALAPHVS
jgi:hypothetical protein